MKTIKNWSLLSLMAFLVACGSGDDPTPQQTEEEVQEETLEEDLGQEVIVDTASDVTTTLADVNGFSLVTTTFNPRSDDVYGTQVSVTAYVKDHSNNPVEDGTVVTFIADDHGLVEDQCATTGGVCSVTWVSAGDRINTPGTPNNLTDYKITVMARTIGEDSFIDKNSNSLFDTNETWFTQSEAYLDSDESGSYDSAVDSFDEYFDFNSNGSFDETTDFTLFRGTSCSTAAISAGHCATQLEVWDSVEMINSHGGPVSLAVTDCSGGAIPDPIDLTTNGCLILEFTDVNGNVPPIGTKITTKTDVGELVITTPGEVPNVFAEPGTGFITSILLQDDDLLEDAAPGFLTIEMESLSGVKTYFTANIDD